DPKMWGILFGSRSRGGSPKRCRPMAAALTSGEAGRIDCVDTQTPHLCKKASKDGGVRLSRRNSSCMAHGLASRLFSLIRVPREQSNNSPAYLRVNLADFSFLKSLSVSGGSAHQGI